MKRLSFWLSLLRLAAQRLRFWLSNKPISPTPHWRPGFHFTPATGWMNDPNGLIVINGRYHLFYQYIPEQASKTYYPFDPARIHWGYSHSPDLLHWTAVPSPIALSPEGPYVPFSGSAVLPDPQQPEQLALLYTACQLLGGRIPIDQAQCLSRCDLSTGAPVCRPHPTNPVLKSPARNVQFRDPNVFRYTPDHNEPPYWVMALAGGHIVRFYRSDDLAQWTALSPYPIPLKDGQFVECPELLHVPINGTNEQTWVLLYAIGGLPGLACTETAYLCGDFDGNRFTPRPDEKPRPIDHGPDFYAAQSWNDPQGRHARPVIAAWMNNWKYAERTPTNPWRGQLSIPRKISLRKTGNTYTLCQQPISAIDACKVTAPVLSVEGLLLEAGQPLRIPAAPELLDIRLQADLRYANTLEIRLRQGNENETRIAYDRDRNVLTLDRTHNNRPGLPDVLRTVHEAELPTPNSLLYLRILLDRSSIEIFGGPHGELALSALIFPEADARDIELYCAEGHMQLDRLDIFELTPIVFHPNL